MNEIEKVLCKVYSVDKNHFTAILYLPKGELLRKFTEDSEAYWQVVELDLNKVGDYFYFVVIGSEESDDFSVLIEPYVHVPDPEFEAILDELHKDTCDHNWVITGLCRYSCPAQHEYKCTKCNSTKWVKEDFNICGN